MIKTKHLWLIALLVGWFCDFLFWEKAPGVSFAIYVLLCLAGGFFIVWKEGKRPARAAWGLLLPIGVFAILSFIRQEPFSLFLDYVLTLALMAMLANTLLGGRWIAYNLTDYASGLVRLFFSVLARPVQSYSANARLHREQNSPEGQAKSSFWRSALPIVRGLLLAIPIVALFGALLSSADPIFSRRLQDFFDLFDMEKLPEYILRTVFILIMAYLLAGVFLHSLFASQDEKLIGDKPWLSPFLGFTEAVTVLASVELLFAFFVGIQFRYFFGGRANITIEGYTYAEYARRGFGELVVVAVLSLLLFLSLSAVTKRQDKRQRWTFSGLGITLVILLGFILTSAFQRLLLYEEAYGFSRLRTYPHVFMIWLGLLLLVFVGLEIAGRTRYFALAALLAAIGFSLTLNLMNVETFIVKQNISRAMLNNGLDSGYLATLSDDSTPALADFYADANLPASLHHQIGGILACRLAALPSPSRAVPWQSFHLSQYQAQKILLDLAPQLSEYTLTKDDYGMESVLVEGKEQPCYVAGMID
jgi:hypothetical protein